MGLEPTTFCMATRYRARRLRRLLMVEPKSVRQREIMTARTGCFGAKFGTKFRPARVVGSSSE